MFTNYLQQSFLLVIVLSGIPLICAALVGVVVAIIQTVTQIQEQSISFTLKIATVAGLLFILGDWYSNSLATFFQQMLGSLQFLGKL
jgi:type III secretion system export apparatus protein